MPSKFVQNTAERMGVSVEHAEKVWHEARAAVKKGKRQGSWYWGKVVNTFKRMMGVKEQLTFKEFYDIEILTEGRVVTIPKMVDAAAKHVLVGNGYYLELLTVRRTKAEYQVKRMLSDVHVPLPVIVTIMDFPGKGRKCLVQAGGAADNLPWAERSRFVSIEDIADGTVDPLAASFMKPFMSNIIATLTMTGVLEEDKKEDGVKKSYLNFRGSEHKKALKGEMKREIKRFSKMDHRDKNAYPDDWTADQKYKAELKKKGKTLPKSEHTKEFERRFGK